MADLYRYQRPATRAASTPAYAAAEIKVRRRTLGRRVGAASMGLLLIVQLLSRARRFFITNLGE